MTGVGEIVFYKIYIYITLLRPFTLLAPLIVSSSIMIASFVKSGNTDFSFVSVFWTIISASICFVLLNGASNSLNQATDWKEDTISKPYRLIPKGIVTPKETYHVSFVLYLSALLLSLTINIRFSFFILIIAFFSITYSLPPRIKKFLFLNQLWVALPRGFLGIIGSWSVFETPFEPLPLAIGSIAALFLFGGTTTKDILDAEADRYVGTKTIVNVFGVKLAIFLSLIFMMGAFVLIYPLVYFHIIEYNFFPLILLSILSFFIGWLMYQKHKNTKYENTLAWTLMYLTYFIFAFSFAIITISFSG